MSPSTDHLSAVLAAVVSVVMGGFALLCGLFVAGTLENVFSDNRDSPLGAYWAIGGTAFALSAAGYVLRAGIVAAALICATRYLRSGHRT